LLDVNLPLTSSLAPTANGAFAFTTAKFCAAQPTQPILTSSPLWQALAEPTKLCAAASTTKKPPDAHPPPGAVRRPHRLHRRVKQQQERSSSPAPKDADIFYLLVFLYRMGLLRTNGRPRSPPYIEFLRSPFPEAQELKREESRIIVP